MSRLLVTSQSICRNAFFSFKDFYAGNKFLTKRTYDTNKEKFNWLSIKWLRYEKPFGIIKFKYTLDENEPFRQMDFNVRRRRTQYSLPTTLPLAYSGPNPINALKKKDLLDLKPFIDEEYYSFYENLTTSDSAPVELQGVSSEDEEN